MTGLKFEKATFILITKEKLPYTAHSRIGDFYAYILCLYCTYHVSELKWQLN